MYIRRSRRTYVYEEEEENICVYICIYVCIHMYTRRMRHAYICI